MRTVDVAVVGGGPAGLAAALETATRGFSTVVLDLGLAPGGQLVKQIHRFFGSEAHGAGTRGINIAALILQRAQEAGVEIMTQAQVYALDPGFRTTYACGYHGGDSIPGVSSSVWPTCPRAESVLSRQLVLATGAAEIPVVFPGWTLPGVMGAGAAQTMANLWRVPPGRRVLMVGSGNVGLIVAYQLLQAGVSVAAVVEAAPRIGGYEVHASKLQRLGVQILTSHTILRADGPDRVSSATVARVNTRWQPIPGTEKVLDVDTVCVAVGLRPNLRLAMLAGSKIEYSHSVGGWHPVHDSEMQTNVRGLYVAGDVAGVEEASIALDEGHLAGIAAARALGSGSSDDSREIKAIRERLAELRGQATSPSHVCVGKSCEERQAKTSSNHRSVTEEPSIVYSSMPSATRYEQGPVAVIECFERIPCNPCEASCPFGAITVGSPITNPPVLDFSRCVGCQQCIAVCPGMAIRVVDLSPHERLPSVSLPYELQPVPEVGEEVFALGSMGNVLCSGVVTRVVPPEKRDRTAVLTVELPHDHVLAVKAIRSRREGYA